MSDPSRSTGRLHDALHAAADELALDPIEPTAIRGRAATRRRRRRAVVGGGITVVAIALVGTVVANRDLGDDTLEFANPPETTQPDASGDQSAPAPVTTPITTPPTLPPADTDPAFDGVDTTAPAGDLVQLLPWRDGFLRIAVLTEPQPLGPIPEEISALFPDEVLALFPDGLPPTIEEATAILSEAGLLDEVTAVLSEHPEASEAIYATEAPPSTLVAGFTTDGASWTTSEMTMPGGYPGSFTVSGDRLVTSSTGPVGDDGQLEVTVAWTDDLATWNETSIDVVATESDVTPPFHQETYVNSIAVAGDRWVARVERHVWVDYESLLPADVRAELNDSQFGYGMSTSDTGLTIDIERADGPPQSYVFTWVELGYEDDPGVGFADIDSSQTLLVGTLDGGAEEIPAPAGGNAYGNVIAGASEFYLVGEHLSASADGRTWSRVDGVPTDRYVASVVPLTNGDLFIMEASTGNEAWLRNDGSFTQVELPDLGLPYGLWNSNPTGAWVVDLGDQGYFEEPPEPITVVVEYEGYELAVTDGPDGSTYELADATTGEMIVDGVVGPGGDDRDSIWEFDEETGTTTVVIRDAAGAEVVRIPGALLTDAYNAAYESNSGSSVGPAEEWTPDFWLIATADGVDWLTLDVPDPTPDGSSWPTSAALNGRTVLYQTPDGWATAEL